MTGTERGTVERLCREAAQAAGADERTAGVLAHATLEAETRDRRMVGVTHFFDYLDGLRQGRIDGRARPQVDQRTPSVVLVDCRAGIAQVGFEDAYDVVVGATRTYGVAMLSLKNAFTVGELGYYVRRLSEAGLIGVAGANSPALMSIGGAPGPVLGTNPLAYAIPRRLGRPVVIDQASSQTAFVSVRSAAAQGFPIPDGWAVDDAGNPTTDADAALRGALLPFGGYKGGNIAMLVELLAVLSGAEWSWDAAPFDSGSTNPGVGMFVIAIDPETFDPSHPDRVESFLGQLSTRWSIDVSKLVDPVPSTECDLDADVVRRLQEAAALKS